MTGIRRGRGASGSNLLCSRRFGARGSASYSYPTHSKQMNHAPKWPTEFRRHMASMYTRTYTNVLAYPTIAAAGALGATTTKRKLRVKYPSPCPTRGAMNCASIRAVSATYFQLYRSILNEMNVAWRKYGELNSKTVHVPIVRLKKLLEKEARWAHES